MSENVYDRFADGEVKVFATKQDVKPRKFSGRLLRNVFPVLASSLMMLSSGCAREDEKTDKDGFIDSTNITTEQITGLIRTPAPSVALWDVDYNHAPESRKNCMKVIRQGLNVINSLSEDSNLSENEILEYKKTAVKMLKRMKLVDGKISNPDLSDAGTLKAFLFFERVVEYKNNYEKVFIDEVGIHNEQSDFLGVNYKDSYRLMQRAKNSEGMLSFADNFYSCANRFVIPGSDMVYANEISHFILEKWLEDNNLSGVNLYKLTDVDVDNCANMVSWYYKKGKDFRGEIKIDSIGDLGDGCFSPVGVNVIHEMLHVSQMKPSSEQEVKDNLIKEVGPSLTSLMLEDMIYKTIHKIPQDNVVDYGFLEIGKNKTSLGELAVWFRNMTQKYSDKSIDGVLCEDEIFSKLEKIGNGEKVTLLAQSITITKDMGR
jgi:hypothetical protein